MYRYNYGVHIDPSNGIDQWYRQTNNFISSIIWSILFYQIAFILICTFQKFLDLQSLIIQLQLISIIKEIDRMNRNITKLEQACRTNFYTQGYILRQRLCFSSIVIDFLEEIPWILYDICTLRIHEESFPHILTRCYRHYTSRLHEHRCATSRRHFLKPRDHTLLVSRFDTIPTVKTKLRNKTVHTLYILLCTCFEQYFCRSLNFIN